MLHSCSSYEILSSSFVLRVEGHEHSIHFRAAMSQAACLHECLTNATEAYTVGIWPTPEIGGQPNKTLFLWGYNG